MEIRGILANGLEFHEVALSERLSCFWDSSQSDAVEEDCEWAPAPEKETVLCPQSSGEHKKSHLEPEQKGTEPFGCQGNV